MGVAVKQFPQAIPKAQVTRSPRSTLPRIRDPRILQILFLTVFLSAGAALRDFNLRPAQIVLAFVAALVTQGMCGRIAGQRPISWPSAIITSIGLSLLLRADNLWAHPLAATVAIGAKFILRTRGKHIFNPANLGVILALLVLPGTWISPGQWGQELTGAGWIILLGMTVASRAKSADISLSFLLAYSILLIIRTLRLEQSWSIPAHQLSNGALLLFAFFMISDPMTIPDRRSVRVLHAALVAILAYGWQFGLYRTNGFIWALFPEALMVPLWDWMMPGERYRRMNQGAGSMKTGIKRMAIGLAAGILLCLMMPLPAARAFCGFYVGKGDAGLYNHASQVVYVRKDNRNVISIMNDYAGEPADFAIVVPVRILLQKSQIHIGDRELFQRLDADSASRLVEYYDPDPCAFRPERMMMAAPSAAGTAEDMASKRAEARAFGVTIAARYTIGEYDIVILSAAQSDGLEIWLQQNGYKLPVGVSRALAPYIHQRMKFFVARVNLKEHQKTGLSYLRPIQFAFDSPKFMLPIRLGMINAQGSQDLIIYALTQNGRVETTNYRTNKMPAGMDLPEYIQKNFGKFYGAMFDHQVDETEMHAVFTEYVWNMGWCDPCAAPPLSQNELRQLGVFWFDKAADSNGGAAVMRPNYFEQVPVVLTRLHVRYSAETFPEDLAFQETDDRQNFQASYVLRYGWNGSESVCPAAKNYFEELYRRRETEASVLADLTGWKLEDIYQQAGIEPNGSEKPSMWWDKLWQ